MSLIKFTDMAVEPDKGTYSESIFYKTNLFISSNNIIASAPLMQEFKYRVKYGVTIHDTATHKAYINIFKMAKKQTVTQPLWGQFIKITASGSGVTTIYVEDTTWSDFRDGRKVALYEFPDKVKMVTLASHTQNTLTFTEPVDVALGMVAMPTFDGFVKDIIKTNYTGERFIKGEMLIEELI